MGIVDAEGRYTIVGREKDLVISGGLNVYPKEIELLIDAIPGVIESAVIGVPHPDFGEAVIAVGGAYGTLSEIGHALSDGIPVIGLKTWPLTTNGDGADIAGAITQAESPSDAVDKALAAAAASNHHH